MGDPVRELNLPPPPPTKSGKQLTLREECKFKREIIT